MQIAEREVGDVQRLRELIAAERDADQRDRFRVALHALQGREKLEIAALLGMAKSTIEMWAYRYRDGGVDALTPAPRGGSVGKITGHAAQKLVERLDAGPVASDRVCALRAKDVQRIARDELGVELSVSSVYRTLHRLGYSCLAPRPRHERQDLAAQKHFTEEVAPFLSAP